MNLLTQLRPNLLRRAADIKEQIELLQRKLAKLLSEGPTQPSTPSRPEVFPDPDVPVQPGTLKEKSRKNRKRRLKEHPHLRRKFKVLAARRKQMMPKWTKQRGQKTSGGPAQKRKMSAAARVRLSALARARSTKAKKAGKSTL
jgi:hypothetical protein